MKLIIRNHKPRAGKHNNQYHGSYTKIFNILDADSLGFVQEYYEESFIRFSEDNNDWVLELNTEPDGNKLEKILALKNVEEYNA
jgi:opacity protein-like surface antigen